MDIKLYRAAHIALKSKAMESLALISVLLENPTIVPDHSSLVEEITKHSVLLAEYEGAMLTLDQYFSPKAAPPQPAPLPPPNAPPITEEQLMERSEAFRNSPPGKAAAAKAPAKTKRKAATSKKKPAKDSE